MEYGTAFGLCPTPESHEYDMGWKRYAGWAANAEDPNFKLLFSKDRMLTYQQKITQLLEGVGKGRPIIVPLDTIGSVLFQCYESNNPQVGDIYSRYIQEGIESQRNDTRDIVDRAINIIVSQIRNEYEITENNRKLTVWNSLYGDFNKQGLRAHAPIKLRKKRVPQMMFMMNY